MKLKGTLTPNGMGGYDLEMSKVSDVKSGIWTVVTTACLGLVGGMATYSGQLLMNYANQKITEIISAKKKKQK